MSGLRAVLRIARRDAWRHRARSALVVVMIALPVLAIVAVDVLIRTVDVSAVESLDRRLGAADALVEVHAGGSVDQDFEMGRVQSAQGAAPRQDRPREEELRAALPRGARLVGLPAGPVRLRTDRGQLQASGEEIDFGDPVTAGLAELVGGRAPSARGEIAVSERLAARGLAPGSTARTEDGPDLRVVGTVRSNREDRRVIAAPGTLALPAPTRWLVEAPGPVAWEQVRRLNELGVTALSRSVVEDPPPRSELPVGVRDQASGPSAAEAAIVGLVVAMALLEVVLLAGPAFAVGARRQRRSLALLAATGGEPKHLRRVVLAGGLVLGVAASLLGVLFGIAAAFVGQGPVQRLTSQLLGPFDVRPLDVAVIAAFGAGSAVLAALAPALSAARQDVVAVLAGRRGQAKAGRAMPVVGLGLLALGITGSVLGATQSGGGELIIAFATVGTVVGAVLLCPSIVGFAGGLARRLPLSARFAVRDAARQRGRTAPAVAAILASVAGVVSLGIAGSSDDAESRALYSPRAPMGTGTVTAPGAAGDATWARVEQVLHRELPDAEVTAFRGLGEPRSTSSGPPARAIGLAACAPTRPGGRCVGFQTNYATSLNTSVPVGSEMLDLLAPDVGADALRAARSVLEQGGVVVLAERGAVDGEFVVRKTETTVDAQGRGTPRTVARWTFPGARLALTSGHTAPAKMILSEPAARTMGIVPEVTALVVRGAAISSEAQDRVQETLGGMGIDTGAETSNFYVERGYSERSMRLVLLLLGAAGGVLVLGGTLTATLLALADARPDFATLVAVGAGPGMRRRVATSYAALLGLLGTLLGTLVGFVPGIAAAYPLTARGWRPTGTEAAEQLPSVFIDVPWLLLAGLTVGVPLVAALGVALFTRGTPSLVRREAA